MHNHSISACKIRTISIIRIAEVCVSSKETRVWIFDISELLTVKPGGAAETFFEKNCRIAIFSLRKSFSKTPHKYLSMALSRAWEGDKHHRTPWSGSTARWACLYAVLYQVVMRPHALTIPITPSQWLTG